MNSASTSKRVGLSRTGTSTNTIRVFVVDDHAHVRASISELVRNENDMCIVGEAESGQEAIDSARMFGPDIVLMDISMPGLDGFSTTRRIRQDLPSIQIVILSQHEGVEYIERAMQAGASGYVIKRHVTQHLLRAIRAVHRGGEFFPVTGSSLTN